MVYHLAFTYVNITVMALSGHAFSGFFGRKSNANIAHESLSGLLNLHSTFEQTHFVRFNCQLFEVVKHKTSMRFEL